MPTESQSKTDPNGKHDPVQAIDPFSAITGFWSQWLEQSSRGTQAMMEAMQTTCDPQQLQGRWTDALARSIDDFLRSPVFLETMSRNLKMMTELRGLQDQVFGGVARELGVPLTEDVAALFDRLRGAEKAIMGRLDAIEDRLKSVEAKIGHGAMPKGVPGGVPGMPAAATGRRPRRGSTLPPSTS